jgi:hypothetical protein
LLFPNHFSPKKYSNQNLPKELALDRHEMKESDR